MGVTRVFVDDVGNVGGAEYVMYDVSKVLSTFKDEYDLEIICTTYLRQGQEIDLSHCDEVIDMTKFVRTLYGKFMLYDNYHVLKSFLIKNIIRRSDIVISHSFFLPHITRGKFNVVFDGRDWDDFVKKLGFLSKLHILPAKFVREKYYENSDIIVCFNSSSRDYFVKKFGSSKILYVPHSLDLSLLRVGTEKKYDFGYLGRFSKEKNPWLVIDTFKNTNFKGLMIGSGEKKKIGNIEILPFMKKEDALSLISQVKVGIVPSLFESFSIATLEFLGMGIPTIVSDSIVTPFDDYVIKFRCGDKRDLFDKFIYVLDNYEYYIKKYRKISKIVRNKYDKNRLLSGTIKYVLDSYFFS